MKYTLTPMKHEVMYRRKWILDGRLDVKFNNFCEKVAREFNEKYKTLFVASGIPAFDLDNMLNIKINRTTRGVHSSYEVMFGTRKFARNVSRVYFSPAHTRIDFDKPLIVPFYIQSGEPFEDFKLDFLRQVNAMEAVELIYNQLKLALKDYE